LIDHAREINARHRSACRLAVYASEDGDKNLRREGIATENLPRRQCHDDRWCACSDGAAGKDDGCLSATLVTLHRPPMSTMVLRSRESWSLARSQSRLGVVFPGIQTASGSRFRVEGGQLRVLDPLPYVDSSVAVRATVVITDPAAFRKNTYLVSLVSPCARIPSAR